MVNYFFNQCCNQTPCLELIHRNKWGTNCVNCGYLSELSHPNELHFIVVGSCEAENVHISQKITLDTASANSFIGSGTAPKVLLGGRAQSWLSYFLPWRRLVDIRKLHFAACEFHFSDNRVLCKAIYSHIARQREHFGLTILWMPVCWSEKDTVYLQACWWGARCLWFPQLTGICRVISSQSLPDVHLPH